MNEGTIEPMSFSIPLPYLGIEFCDHLENLGLGSVDALFGPFDGDESRVHARTRETHHHSAKLLGQILQRNGVVVFGCCGGGGVGGVIDVVVLILL